MEFVRGETPFMPWSPGSVTQDEMRRFIEESIAGFAEGRGFRFGIIGADGRLLGTCGVGSIDRVNRRANVWYWVRPSAQRQGVASAAARQTIAWALANTDLVRLEIAMAVDNLP